MDNSSYLNPNDAALAVVATSMKKARLKILTLALNAILGGILFSCGGLLDLAVQCDSPKIFKENIGILNACSGVTFGVALFYVIIMGVDLYNSNILYFSVGLLRHAVSIYDLAISWVITWLGNIAGSLLLAYVFAHLSGISTNDHWKVISIDMVESKASFSFIQTFLKGIAGNFLVCLAVYLQIMVQPFHVKLILLILPIFTFVTVGFTHVVGDMLLCYVGMLNGAHVSVGKYIWKLLIPATVGNAIGGFAFSLAIPFYLHLVVVEQDRKRLSMPEYEAKDEQPDINMDSRVVRVPVKEESDSEESTPAETEEKPYWGDQDKEDTTPSEHSSEQNDVSTTSSESSLGSESSNEGYSNRRQYPAPSAYTQADVNTITPATTRRSRISRTVSRSPPGVFPILGMGEPLAREKTIANSNYASRAGSEMIEHLKEASMSNKIGSKIGHTTSYSTTAGEPSSTYNLSRFKSSPTELYDSSKSMYNPLSDKPGAVLKRVMTKFSERTPKGNDIEKSPENAQTEPSLHTSVTGANYYKTQSLVNEVKPSRPQEVRSWTDNTVSWDNNNLRRFSTTDTGIPKAYIPNSSRVPTFVKTKTNSFRKTSDTGKNTNRTLPDSNALTSESPLSQKSSEDDISKSDVATVE